MKRIIFLFLAALLAVPALSPAGVISPARVHMVDGDVMFRTPDTEEWLPTAVNTPLDEGDALWTPDGSRVEIQLSDGSIVRLDGGSQLDLIAVEDGFTHLHLGSGRVYVRTAQKAGKGALQIDADDTTIIPDARTRLRIDMLPNSQEDVAIFKGSAYVEGNGERTKVRAGEHIALEEGHSELLPLNPPDAWEQWNVARDRSQTRTASADAVLPEELQAYSGELDSHGRWVSVPEYGMVWRPTVILSDEWAPYRSGRWIWKGDDYVWVSYESWGWAPYHYGRWAVVTGFGWCWVPPLRGDIYWGPGYVGWYRSGSHVGWTPLAPGETFYGRRHYGLHSVTITGSSSIPAVTYRNREARGGFSVLLQNDFLRGRSVFQNPSRATVSVSVSPGSPRIQPLRETRMPVIKQTPPRIAPPALPRHDNRELRARFPRVQPVIGTQRRDQPAGVPPAPAPSSTERRNPATGISQPRTDTPSRTETPRTIAAPPARRDQPLPQAGSDRQKPPPAASRTGEGQRAGGTRGEQKQKRVWRVTTTEQGNEKAPKERENREQQRGRR